MPTHTPVTRYALAFFLIIAILPGCAPTPEPTGRRPLPSEEIPTMPTPDIMQSTAEWAYQQGLQSLAQEDYAKAIQAFHLALERDPQHVRSYLSLGEVYSLQEEFLVAETYYNKVLQFDPRSIPAINGLATMHWRKGNHRDALTLYRKTLEIDPNNQFARQQSAIVTRAMFDQHYARGLEYKQDGDLVQAAVEFQKAYSADPENWAFGVEIGLLFLQQEDYEMADGYFQQVLSAKPDFLPAITGAGRVQLGLRHYDEAIRYFERAHQLNPTDQETEELLRQAQREQVNASLPEQYWQIMTSEQVTRGEIAALLIVDLMLEQRVHTPDKVVIISDITNHWAKTYIIKVVQHDIMSLPPDRFFRPNEPITRGELAFVIDTLFRAIGQPLPQDSRLPFADVHPDNAYYDAIARVYSAGLMQSLSATTFGTLDSLFGEEALNIFEKIRGLMR